MYAAIISNNETLEIAPRTRSFDAYRDYAEMGFENLELKSTDALAYFAFLRSENNRPKIIYC